jgi:hypothetical protein
MTSLKQIEANRLNAGKSTGPRTEEGKQRSRQNALSHGLTAETVITALEHAADYQAFEASIASDYRARTVTECVLISRLASLLWRLRRSTSIETGLFQIEGEQMRARSGGPRRGGRLPEWCDELDAVPSTVGFTVPTEPDRATGEASDLGQTLADCFLRVSRPGYGTFDLLNRYETMLWRQTAQLLFMLQAAARR